MEKPNYRHPIKVYTPLLRIERVIYSISDWRLPFPISLRQMGFFLLGFGIIWILGRLPVIGSLINGFWVGSYVIIPILIAMYLDKAKLDGKPPLIYLIDKFQYAIQKGHYNRYERIEKQTKNQFTGAVGFRKGEEN